MSAPIVNFFMLGGPKCGTTAMRDYLAEHPQIFMSTPKEPHYFCTDLETRSLVRPGAPLQEYHDTFFHGHQEEAVAGEASVWNLYSREAVGNILSYNPEAKFLAMVRNPVTMAYSLHAQFVSFGAENVKDFSKAFALCEKRRQGQHIPGNFPWDPKLLQYGEVAKFGEQITRAMERIHADRLLVLVQDDFRNDTAGTYARVLKFLGLPPDGRTDFIKINVQRRIKNPLLAKLLQADLVSVTAQAAKRLLGIKSFGVGMIKPPMPGDVRHLLADHYKDDVALLSKLLNRDLDHWITPK